MTLTITLTESLTFENVIIIRKQLLSDLEKNDLVLDISNPLLDSSAVALCIELKRTALKNQKTFQLNNYPEKLKTLFKLYKIKSFQ
ncbi:MAG: STAS domain-containing protein [Neisseriaceae bacterium]|nr:STAS domain-containing protein [Neisseriaceae bacterium]